MSETWPSLIGAITAATSTRRPKTCATGRKSSTEHSPVRNMRPQPLDHVAALGEEAAVGEHTALGAAGGAGGVDDGGGGVGVRERAALLDRRVA